MDTFKLKFQLENNLLRTNQNQSKVGNRSEQFKSTFSSEQNENISKTKSSLLLMKIAQMNYTSSQGFETERVKIIKKSDSHLRKKKYIQSDQLTQRRFGDSQGDITQLQKSKAIIPFTFKRIRRVSENFDIFNAPETKKPELNMILFQKNVYKNSQYTIEYFNKEMEKIKSDSACQMTILAYMRECHQKLKQIQRSASEAYDNFNERVIVENSVQQIIEYANILKNTGFTIMTTYLMAKLISMYNNPIQAIHLYKQCKRLSDCEEYYKLKMKCYRQLGELFINIDSSLAKLYLTKFLIAAWKLNNRTRELLAYELLGKYYFYNGDMEKAKQFHLRMMKGDCEPKNTRMRQLAVARLNHGSVGKTKPNTFIEKQQEFQVTSDDEVYEVILPNVKVENEKNKVLHIRLMPAKKNEIYSKANLNIRRQKTEISQSIDHNSRKDIIQLSHLSPNRNLNIFQTMALLKDQKNSENLEACLTDKGQRKAKKLINKYISIVQFVAQQLQQMSHNIIQNDQNESRSPLMRRKGYLIQ